MTTSVAELAVSVVIPTHNPRMDYLRRVLEALRGQTLARERWELVVVDNNSQPPLRVSIRHAADGIREDGGGGGHTVEGKRQEASLPSHVPTFPPSTEIDLGWHPHARIVREEELGLTFARLRGFAEARGELIVMVDDDNLLDPDYLANAVSIAEEHKDIRAFGGKCLPEFETQPESWMKEFLSLLALRDHGDAVVISGDVRSADGSRRAYPDRAAPIGAGMVLRREAAAAYAERMAQRACGIRHTADGEEGASVEQCCGRVVGKPELPKDRNTEPRLGETALRQPPSQRAASVLTDRRGDSLASAGDNDLVFHVLRDGWKVGYFPQLMVTHLIPAGRLTVDYLARANRGIQRSWVQVLRKHDACPWPVIPAWSLPLRKAKASMAQRPWCDASSRIRLAGVIGRLEGQVG